MKTLSELRMQGGEDSAFLQRMAQRVSNARGHLLLDYPWYGSLALRLKVEATLAYPTMATDGTKLLYNPRFVDRITDSELKGVWAHEVTHCAVRHPYRFGGRDFKLANIAADYAVNAILRKDGITLPARTLYDPSFEGMSFEQIYSILDKERQAEAQKQREEAEKRKSEQVQSKDSEESGQSDTNDSSESEDGDSSADETPDDSGDGDADTESEPDASDASEGSGSDDEQAGEEFAGDVLPAPGPEQSEGDEQPMTETDWGLAVEQAAFVSRKAGTMPGGADLAIQQARKSATGWREIIERFVEQVIPSDSSWEKPNRRHISKGLYLPSVTKEIAPRLVIVVDTSFSILGARLLDLFTEEINRIKADVKPEEIVVLYVDAAVQKVESFGIEDEVELHPVGGGGTLFQPAFDWIDEQQEQPAAAIYLTDLENGGEELTEPDFPVLWATSESTTLDGPFGETVRLSEWH